MASNRHLGRIVALQSLYELDLKDMLGDESLKVDEIVDRNLGHYEDTIGDKDYVRRLVQGVFEKANQLDARVQPIAPEWPIKQISIIDRAILRMSVFELENLGDIVPPKVAINEAVELAKSFGSENSSKFINGVLGTIYRQDTEGEEENESGETGKSEPEA
ncbi:MAG: transcription antitermination factor NusB [Candidatus Nomurabacteria bacterium]|jgi:N utilization substance protein B|nr:transcription antitermination factor NusB [Candidatus Nomurabacteria bacterium]